jgi:hypothetical protein
MLTDNMVQRSGGTGAQYERVDGKYVAKRTTHVTDDQLDEYRRKAITAMEKNNLHVSGRGGPNRTRHAALRAPSLQ